MLNILLTRKTQDFFKYMAQSHKEDIVVVTPNPIIADNVRTRFDNVGRSVNSITISKFIKDELNLLFPVEILENYKGKSELILLLGAIWKKIGKGDDYINFKRAFNLLTEFRSFTMSSQVLETVLEHYDSELSEGVLWLHRFLEEMEVIDEHKSYFMLAERLREGDLPPDYPTEKTIVFYGFDFMTGSQVDLLKSIALRDNVFLTLYKEAYDKTQMLDWVQWFDEHNLNVDDISLPLENELTSQLMRYPKGYFSKTLKSLNIENKHFLLGTKGLTRENVQELAVDDLSFKISADLFGDDHKKITNLIENDLDKSIEKNIELDKLKENLKSYSDTFIKDQSFRELKVCLNYLMILNHWESLSSDNDVIGKFDLKILSEAAELDLPRTNLTTISNSKQSNIVKSIKNLDEFKNEEIIFGVHVNHGGINGIGANYSENVEKYLSSIGPIRRAEFEVNTLKCRLEEFISDNDVLLLIEDGIIEHDTTWSKIISNLELEELSRENLKVMKPVYKLDSSIENNLSKISASRLQKYIECPRKYYLQFIEKTMPQIDFDDELNVLEIGQIEHEIIEKYFESTKEINEEIFEKTILVTLNKYIATKKISQKLREEYLVEVKAYTWSTINALVHLIEEFELKELFEFDFQLRKNETLYSGSIDCYLKAKTGNTKILIDFKRSNYSFKSLTSILKFEQIQLWFYLQRLIELQEINTEDTLVFGYIDLSNSENSSFFSNDKDYLKTFKKVLGKCKTQFIADFDAKIEEYGQYENDAIVSLEKEELFYPKPFNKDSCGYCSVASICPRDKELYGNA